MAGKVKNVVASPVPPLRSFVLEMSDAQFKRAMQLHRKMPKAMKRDIEYMRSVAKLVDMLPPKDRARSMRELRDSMS